MNQTGEVLSEAEDQVLLELDSEAGEDTSSINEHGHVNAGVTHAHGQHSHTPVSYTHLTLPTKA